MSNICSNVSFSILRIKIMQLVKSITYPSYINAILWLFYYSIYVILFFFFNTKIHPKLGLRATYDRALLNKMCDLNVRAGRKK